MRQLITLAILLFGMIGGLAATITGNLTATDSTNHVTTVTLVPINGGHASGTNYYYAVTQSTRTDTNGVFNLTAVQGDYRITIASEPARTLTVPDSTNTFNFLDLIVAAPTYVYRTPGSLVKVSTNDHVFGFLSDKLVAGTSILLTPTGLSNETLVVALDSAIAASIAAKLPLSGGIMTGSVTNTTASASAWRDQQGAITHAGTVTLDFATNTVNSLSLTGDVTFATANLVAGATYKLLITATSTNDAFTFPAWRFAGLLPTNIVGGTIATLELEAWGTNDTNVVAHYEEE